jgi:uncharacterized protein YukE
MAMIGADLGAMGQLASRFSSTGEAFNARSTDLVGRVETATEQFRQRMNALKTEADSLGAEIREEMARLSARANSVEWTGDHRSRHDEVLQSLDAEIVSAKTAIDTFSTEAKGIVDGQLTTVLTDLRGRVTEYGSTARSVASDFEVGVSRQREAIDSVMNG